jgi:hypothetical protein
MHDMDWVHWIGVALATPPTVLVLAASWRARAARTRRRPSTTEPIGISTTCNESALPHSSTR